MMDLTKEIVGMVKSHFESMGIGVGDFIYSQESLGKIDSFGFDSESGPFVTCEIVGDSSYSDTHFNAYSDDFDFYFKGCDKRDIKRAEKSDNE